MGPDFQAAIKSDAAGSLGIEFPPWGDPETARVACRHEIESGPDQAAAAAGRLGDSAGTRDAYVHAMESRHPEQAPIAAVNPGGLLALRHGTH